MSEYNENGVQIPRPTEWSLPDSCTQKAINPHKVILNCKLHGPVEITASYNDKESVYAINFLCRKYIRHDNYRAFIPFYFFH